MITNLSSIESLSKVYGALVVSIESMGLLILFKHNRVDGGLVPLMLLVMEIDDESEPFFFEMVKLGAPQKTKFDYDDDDDLIEDQDLFDDDDDYDDDFEDVKDDDDYDEDFEDFDSAPDEEDF
jgi:hypothetical protein